MKLLNGLLRYMGRGMNDDYENGLSLFTTNRLAPVVDDLR
jgi:hypothetical protein